MKNHLKILVCLLIIFLLTGCCSYNFDFKINENRTLDFDFLYTVAYGNITPTEETLQFYQDGLSYFEEADSSYALKISILS